jgi:hypothetical protein
LIAAPVLLGSIPSFCSLSIRNATSRPLLVSELYGAHVGQRRTAWANAEARFEYLARNVGLMGCIAVASAPQGLTGWLIADESGQRIVVARERFSELRTVIVVREEDLARGQAP